MAPGRDRRGTDRPLVHRPPQPVGRKTQDPCRAAGAQHLARDRRQLANPRLRKPTVAARRRLIGTQPPLPARSDHGVLADAKQPCRYTGAYEPVAAAQIGRRRAGHAVHVLETEAMLAARAWFLQESRFPRATARRTVAWLTPRRLAASLELINLCKTCAGLTTQYHEWIDSYNPGLGISRAT